MNQKPAKITVASLANASKLVDAAGRVLTWHKTKPSCKVASRFKVSWISHRSDDSRRCDDTYARNAYQPLASIDLRGERGQRQDALPRISGKSKLAEAIRYAISRRAPHRDRLQHCGTRHPAADNHAKELALCGSDGGGRRSAPFEKLSK